MKPFVLRRLKREVLKDLPTKTDVTLLCPLERSQREKYDDLIQTFSQQGTQAVINMSSSNNCHDYLIMSIHHSYAQIGCY
jgi:SNF2 family DNA or RNA helicase